MANSNADWLPPGSPRTNSLPRRDSSSTNSSGAYQPLPAGRWVLDVHGNCSKCHHHHGSARVRVNVPSNDNDTITHVRCQRCHEKWLAFGCRNQTQLSLLSINSITPDPAAASVQHSLAMMVRSATAIASPTLSGIPELPSSPAPSRQPSFRVAPIDTAQADERFRRQPMGSAPLFRFMDPTTVHPQASIPSSTSLSPYPGTSQRYGLHTGRLFSNLRDHLGSRFPALHRANLSRRLSIMRQPRMPANPIEQQPLRVDTSGESTMTADHTQEEHNQEELSQEQLEQSPASLPRLSTSSDIANQFLTALANDTTNLGALTDQEKATWVREKYTEFRNQTARPGATHTTAYVGTPTDLNLAVETLRELDTNLQSELSQDLLGIGSHYGQFDGYRPNRASTFTVSSSTRISEADTLWNDTNTVAVTSSPRFSLAEIVRRERSGSPRPPSINVGTLRRLRNSGEIRY